MNTLYRSLLIGAAFVALGASAANAGGMYGGSVKDVYIPGPVSAPSPSWYFRVDGAYGGHDDPIMVEDGSSTLTETRLDGAWSVGGGIGRYFTPNIRGDITVDHRFEADASGRLPDPNINLPGTRHFGLKSTAVLFNMYYDFEAHSHFTPYVGVGIGWVRHSTTDGVVDGECGCTGVVDGESTTDVAAAVMAGASITLLGGRQTATTGGSIKDLPVVTDTRNLYLDVGYRFLYLGEATTGPVRGTNGTNFQSNDPTVEDIHAHEIRFGLRYDFR